MIWLRLKRGLLQWAFGRARFSARRSWLNDCFRLLLGFNQRDRFLWFVIWRQLFAVHISAGRQKIGGQSRALLCEAGTHLLVQARIFVLRLVKIAEHPGDLMKFLRNSVWLVFRGFRKFQNPVFPDFRKLRCTRGCQFFAEFFDGAETLGDRRIEREQWADNVDRDRLGRRVMGLGMKKQAVPEMMRIFRLIETATRCFGDDEIGWMID